MKIETSISLLDNDGNKFKCVKHNVVLQLTTDHALLKNKYNLENPCIEAEILDIIVNRKFNVDDDLFPNPSEKQPILFPIAEFELCNKIYYVFLFGQYYADYIVVHDCQTVMTIDHDLSEAISDELHNRSVKFEHQYFSASFHSLMQNFVEGYIRNFTFEEYLNLPNVAEESFYLDIAAY